MLAGTSNHTKRQTTPLETAMDLDTTAIPGLWAAYGHYAVIGTLTAALACLILAIRHKPNADRDNVSIAVTTMALLLTAEGMYVVLTTKLSTPLPWWFALVVCSVAEGLMVNFFRLAKDFNNRHGRLGPYGSAFWIVATAEGCLVALASTNVVEVGLRLLLPLGVALLHWTKLTAERGKANRGRWAWTPLSLMTRIGAWKPGDATIAEEQERRHEMALTKAAYMLASARFFKTRRARRVRRLMLEATPEMGVAVIERLTLAYGIEARITAATTTGAKAVDEARGEYTPTITTPVPVQSICTPKTNGASQTTPGAITAYPLRIEARRTTAERDADIVIRYWSSLTGLIQVGTLCRSAVERTCTVGDDKVLARQAHRIVGIVKCAWSIDDDDIERRVRTAIDMISANKA